MEDRVVSVERLPIEHAEFVEYAPNQIYFSQQRRSASSQAFAWIDDYEIRTLSRFTSFNSNIKEPDASKFVGATIRYEITGERSVTIAPDGVPFILLGNKILECFHGTCRHERKSKLAWEQKKRMCPDFKSRKRKVTTKLDCPAYIAIRCLVRFPAYKCHNLTKSIKSKYTACLKKDLADGVHIDWEHRVYVNYPKSSDHQNHMTEELGSMSQNVDKRLIAKIHSLVREGIHTTKVVKEILFAYSKENFPEVPEVSNRFYPALSDVRNHVHVTLKQLKKEEAELLQSEAQHQNENTRQHTIGIENVIDECLKHPNYRPHSETMIPDYPSQQNVPEAVYEVTAPSSTHIYYQQQDSTYVQDPSHQIQFPVAKPKKPKKAKKRKLETLDHNQLFGAYSHFTPDSEPLEHKTATAESIGQTGTVLSNKQLAKQMAETRNLDARCKMLITNIEGLLPFITANDDLQAVFMVLLKLHTKIRSMLPTNKKSKPSKSKYIPQHSSTNSIVKLAYKRLQEKKRKDALQLMQTANSTARTVSETETAVSTMGADDQVYYAIPLTSSQQESAGANVMNADEIYTATQIDTNYLDEGNQSRLNDTENYVHEGHQKAGYAASGQVQEVEGADDSLMDTEYDATETDGIPAFHKARFMFTPKAPEPEPEMQIPASLKKYKEKKVRPEFPIENLVDDGRRMNAEVQTDGEPVKKKTKNGREIIEDPVFATVRMYEEEDLNKLWNNTEIHGNTLVVSVGEYIMKKESFDALRSTLTQEVMDCYLELLVQMKKDTKILHMDVINCTKLFHGLPLPPDYLDDVKIADYQAVVGVIGPKQGHWILMVILPEKKKVYYLNPLDEINIDKGKYLQRWFNYLCNRHRRELETKAPGEWSLDTVVPFSGYMDITSCGIYILKVAERYIGSETFELEWNWSMLEQERKRIGLLLMSLGKKSMRKNSYSMLTKRLMVKKEGVVEDCEQKKKTPMKPRDPNKTIKPKMKKKKGDKAEVKKNADGAKDGVEMQVSDNALDAEVEAAVKHLEVEKAVAEAMDEMQVAETEVETIIIEIHDKDGSDPQSDVQANGDETHNTTGGESLDNVVSVAEMPIETALTDNVAEMPIQTTLTEDVAEIPIETALTEDVAEMPIQTAPTVDVAEMPIETAPTADVAEMPIETALTDDVQVEMDIGETHDNTNNDTQDKPHDIEMSETVDAIMPDPTKDRKTPEKTKTDETNEDETGEADVVCNNVVKIIAYKSQKKKGDDTLTALNTTSTISTSMASNSGTIVVGSETITVEREIVENVIEHGNSSAKKSNTVNRPSSNNSGNSVAGIRPIVGQAVGTPANTGGNGNSVIGIGQAVITPANTGSSGNTAIGIRPVVAQAVGTPANTGSSGKKSSSVLASSASSNSSGNSVTGIRPMVGQAVGTPANTGVLMMNSSGQVVNPGNIINPGNLVNAGGLMMTSGGIIMNSGGYMVNNNGFLVPANSGGLMMNNGGLLMNNGGLLMNPGGLVMNNPGVLMMNNQGVVVSSSGVVLSNARNVGNINQVGKTTNKTDGSGVVVTNTGNVMASNSDKVQNVVAKKVVKTSAIVTPNAMTGNVASIHQSGNMVASTDKAQKTKIVETPTETVEQLPKGVAEAKTPTKVTTSILTKRASRHLNNTSGDDGQTDAETVRESASKRPTTGVSSTRKESASKPTLKELAPKPTLKELASKPTRKESASKPTHKESTSKPTLKELASKRSTTGMSPNRSSGRLQKDVSSSATKSVQDSSSASPARASARLSKKERKTWSS